MKSSSDINLLIEKAYSKIAEHAIDDGTNKTEAMINAEFANILEELSAKMIPGSLRDQSSYKDFVLHIASIFRDPSKYYQFEALIGLDSDDKFKEFFGKLYENADKKTQFAIANKVKESRSLYQIYYSQILEGHKLMKVNVHSNQIKKYAIYTASFACALSVIGVIAGAAQGTLVALLAAHIGMAFAGVLIGVIAVAISIGAIYGGYQLYNISKDKYLNYTEESLQDAKSRVHGAIEGIKSLNPTLENFPDETSLNQYKAMVMKDLILQSIIQISDDKTYRKFFKDKAFTKIETLAKEIEIPCNLITIKPALVELVTFKDKNADGAEVFKFKLENNEKLHTNLSNFFTAFKKEFNPRNLKTASLEKTLTPEKFKLYSKVMELEQQISRVTNAKTLIIR